MLSDSDKQWLLRLAKKALVDACAGKPLAVPSLTALPPALTKKRGLFVTLRRGGALRGCMGHLDPDRPLGQQVMETAVQSAFGDPRFPPLAPAELAGLHIEVSLLSPLRRVAHPDAIQPGRHGVLLQLGHRSGLFLPQVWEETGWDKDTFLSELCAMKAGLPPSAWKDPACALWVFEVESVSSQVSDLPEIGEAPEPQ